MNKKTIDEQIQEFKDYRGDKSFHIDGGCTLYPGKPNEKHYPSRIVKGPLRWNKCKLCDEPIKEIHRDNPKRRVLKFCSDECRKEHDEIKKIRKKLCAETISWPPQKPLIRKEQLTYTMKGEGGKPHNYKARKIKI